MGDLVIIGAGGSSRDIIDLVGDIGLHAGTDGERWEIRGRLDDDQDKQGQIICGIPVIGPLPKLQTCGLRWWSALPRIATGASGK